MSRTTGIQDLLVNIVRPVYTYNSITTSFTPSITLSNIDAYSGTTITVETAAVGDPSGNTYVGVGAGNVVSLGPRECRGVTAIGFNAGNLISNVANSVFVGSNAGVGAGGVDGSTGNVSVGAGAVGAGSSNVRIGNAAGGEGSRCVVIGASSTSSTFSDAIVVGTGLTATADRQFRVGPTFLYGDMSANWLGIGTATRTSNARLDVSGNVCLSGQIGVGVGGDGPVRTLDVNGDMQASDGGGSFLFADGLTTSTHGFGSLQGTVEVTGGVKEIGVLRRGIVIVSAVDQATSANRAARILFAYTVSNASEIGSNDAGSASITLDGSNIRVTDAANGTYAWSITYVPLP
jgi:hypothetical protein